MARGKVFIFSVLFALIISFLLVIPGKSKTPNSTFSPRISPGSPLMILLDNSGSMGKCSQKDAGGQCLIDRETPYRINIVKDAIRKRINKTDLVSTKIGLAELGNYKS